MENFTDKNGKTYKVANGTFYSSETPNELINILENCRKNNLRIKLNYGDPKTGKSWNKENDITGTIGRSTGNIKIPLLIPTRRSFGGGAIMDNRILKITSEGKTIYQVENFQKQTFEIVKSDMPEYESNVLINGELYSRHKNLKSAKMLIAKLS